MMRVVDTRGKLCPVPLIETKKALKECKEGEVFTVLIDNKTSVNNVTRFLKDNHAATSLSESGGVWSLEVTKTENILIKPDAEEYCNQEISHFTKGDYIVVLSSEKVGEGDDELGRILMKSFFRALHDIDKLPGKIIFYNSAVKLVTKTSVVISDIKDLERMGVEILLCSTCVNHYSLNESIETGTLSNMFVIAELMANAAKVIKP